MRVRARPSCCPWSCFYWPAIPSLLGPPPSLHPALHSFPIYQQVTRMRPGDRVVPIEHGQGTWRSHGVFNVSWLMTADVAAAAIGRC